MKTRLFFVIYILILFFLFSYFFIAKRKNYNVILIAIDPLQARHLNFYGYPINSTPHLNDFFNTSYVFMNAIAPSSWTLSSAMSLFTSMYPDKHKIQDKYSFFNTQTGKGVKLSNLHELNPTAVTIAEILKKNNYFTAGYTQGGGMLPGFGFNQGFAVYEHPAKKNSENKDSYYSILESIQWLRKNKNKKFFLFIRNSALHEENDLSNGFDYKYVKSPYRGKYTGKGSEVTELKNLIQENKKPHLSQDDISFFKSIYDEKINNMDIQMGLLLEELEKLELLDSSIVIFLSNHGTEYFEHGKFNHGHTLYQELIHVPLAIRLPGQTKGKKIESLVSTIDIMPTILSMLNIKNPVPHQTRGIDLSPAFLGEDVSHDVYAE